MTFDYIFEDKGIQLISRAAHDLGIDAFVVGGYVRDLMLKRGSKDIDILTLGEGSSERLSKEVTKRMGRGTHLSIFKNFGTAQVKRGDAEYEFVTARKESYRKESRNPECEPGTLRDDLSRRDFTLNAMCIRLNDRAVGGAAEGLDAGLGNGKKGELIDLFEGERDLEYGILRTPLEPNVTFSDDPLRMMRCMRFASQLGMCPEEETFAAVKANAERIKIISKERIKDELMKIMMSKRPSVGLYFMQESGLMERVLRDVAKLSIVETKNGRAHKDNFLHTMQVVDSVAEKTEDVWTRVAALLHDIGKPQTKRWEESRGWTFHGHEYLGSKMIARIFREMTLPLGTEMEKVRKLVSLHMRPINLCEEGITDSAIRRLLFEAGEDIDDLMILCDADITSHNAMKRARFHQNYVVLRQKMKEIEEKDHLRLFQPPVSGNEIMEIFGLQPCREVGLIKDKIKEAILDGQIANEREAALKLMYEVAKELGIECKKE